MQVLHAREIRPNDHDFTGQSLDLWIVQRSLLKQSGDGQARDAAGRAGESNRASGAVRCNAQRLQSFIGMAGLCACGKQRRKLVTGEVFLLQRCLQLQAGRNQKLANGAICIVVQFGQSDVPGEIKIGNGQQIFPVRKQEVIVSPVGCR